MWIVLTTALLGNTTVLLVLATTSHDRSLPRMLMSHLATADLSMAIYLLLLAIMDLVSVDEYFNYAAAWQLGEFSVISFSYWLKKKKIILNLTM